MDVTNDEDEGDEKILMSKRFHSVSLKQTCTQKHPLWIKSALAMLFLLLRHFETLQSNHFSIFSKEKKYQSIHFKVLKDFSLLFFSSLKVYVTVL